MISEKARELFSEEGFRDGERTIIFLEEETESVVFRLFRAAEGAGDPEQRAIRWLERARSLCRSAHRELRTGMIRSRNGESVMAAASGREIGAKE